MIIGSAIKLIQADIDDDEVLWDSSLGKAYKLAFEALKYYEAIKIHDPKYKESCLPGETED